MFLEKTQFLFDVFFFKGVVISKPILDGGKSMKK